MFNKHAMYSLLACVATLMAWAPLPAQAEWGTLKGRFVFDGPVPQPQKVVVKQNQNPEFCAKHNLHFQNLVVDDQSKGIANIAVYCRERSIEVSPEVKKALPKMVQLDNNCCQFEPHVVCLTLEQQLKITNSDPINHNAKITPIRDEEVNPLLAPAPGGKPFFHKFNRAQRTGQPVLCSYHPWMKAWVLPRDNPYFAVTDRDGNFEIKGLPAGKQIEFQVWHEMAGYLKANDWKSGRFEVTIPADGVKDIGVIKVSPELFQE